MADARNTPPLSRSSSSGSKASKPSLSLDFSDLPPLVQPSPPSNTLLITNLQDSSIFTSANLDTFRQLLVQQSGESLNSYSPLKSFRRIIVSFCTIDAAIHIRSILDGENFGGHRVKIYFGESTPVDAPRDQHLQAPSLTKQFFISPPPSPPHGWESKEEEPPNKEVHAFDLAQALEKLSAKKEGAPVTQEESPSRQRSGSTTIVFNPDQQGISPDLPAIAVEDTTCTPDKLSPTIGANGGGRIIAHTSRPPVELMSQ